jgi:hypothetical protein
MTIALLCPTRARAEQFNRMSGSAFQTADNLGNIKIYAAFTDGDTHLPDYVLQRIHKSTIYPEGVPTAYKWNLLAEQAMADGATIFMLCADDVIFSTPCWDKALLDHYNALENKIHAYHLLDSRNPEGTPHPIFTREWIEFFGYMLPPIFLHWRVDTWSTDIAKAAEVFTHMKEYMLIHDKPSDVGKPDETHNRIRNWGWHDRDQYVHAKCQHYLDFDKRRLQAYILSKNAMKKGKLAPYDYTRVS